MRVFIYCHLIFETWSKFFRFFLKLIDRDLSHKHREIFYLRFTSLVTHGNVCLVRKSEFLILTHVVDISAGIFLDSFFAGLFFSLLFDRLNLR